jgi:hypothetical protein
MKKGAKDVKIIDKLEDILATALMAMLMATVSFVVWCLKYKMD